MRNKIVYIGVSVMMVLFIMLWGMNFEREIKEEFCREKCIENKYSEEHLKYPEGHILHKKFTYEECYERCTSMKD